MRPPEHSPFCVVNVVVVIVAVLAVAAVVVVVVVIVVSTGVAAVAIAITFFKILITQKSTKSKNLIMGLAEQLYLDTRL